MLIFLPVAISTGMTGAAVKNILSYVWNNRNIFYRVSFKIIQKDKIYVFTKYVVFVFLIKYKMKYFI